MNIFGDMMHFLGLFFRSRIFCLVAKRSACMNGIFWPPLLPKAESCFKIISHYKKIGYNTNVLQQTACLVVNPITVGNFSFLFNCTPVGRTSDSMMVPT